MIYRMIMGDLLRFVTIYVVFVMGFSQGKPPRMFDSLSRTERARRFLCATSVSSIKKHKEGRRAECKQKRFDGPSNDFSSSSNGRDKNKRGRPLSLSVFSLPFLFCCHGRNNLSQLQKSRRKGLNRAISSPPYKSRLNSFHHILDIFL